MVVPKVWGPGLFDSVVIFDVSLHFYVVNWLFQTCLLSSGRRKYIVQLLHNVKELVSELCWFLFHRRQLFVGAYCTQVEPLMKTFILQNIPDFAAFLASHSHVVF